jgi:hypothetical protein
MDAAESQMCHAFAEPGGHGRTQKDTTAVEIEYRRTPEEPAWRSPPTPNCEAGDHGLAGENKGRDLSILPADFRKAPVGGADSEARSG